jgi:membrane protein implicated in regulation of membrane protease activity
MTFAIVFWSILLVAAVIAEFGTQQLVSIWFAAGSIVALITAAVGGSEMVQLVVFTAVSLVLLIFTRPILQKFLRFEIRDTNAKADLGKNAVVIQEIDPQKGTGRARLGDVEWRAVSSDSCIIQVGSVVKVLDIDGTRLIVESATEKQTIN